MLSKIMTIKFKAALVLLSLFASMAQAVPLLYDIRYNPLLSGEIEFEFVFDEEIGVMPKIQIFNNPPRFEVFFKAADFEQNLANVAIQKAGVQSIQTQFENEGVKIIITLDYLKIYQNQLKGNIYSLKITDNPTPQEIEQIAGEITYINKINALDFRRGDKGEGRVLVFLDNSTAAANVTEKDDKITIELFNIDLLPELLYLLDVADFGTVVSTIETFKEGANTSIVLTTTGPYTVTHQQIESIFTIAVEKDHQAGGVLGNSKQYTGKPISLNFQDIPVRTALQIIADYNGFNLVTSDSVKGSLTLRLDGTPWDQALDIVLKVKDSC